MKSAWLKNNFRELKKTLGRFLAMVSIVALGVGFFVGLKSTRPVMVETCSQYLDELNFFDLQLISSIAFDEDAARAYAGLDGVAAAEPSITAPMLTELENNEQVFETRMLLPTINQVKLVAGRMPQAPNECLADDLALSARNLGLELQVNPQENNPFSQDSYTVVGLCTSPLYLGTTRGSTSLGNGTLRGFLYLTPEGYDADYYTEIYIRLDGDRSPFDPAYLDALDAKEDTFLPIMEDQGEIRLNHFKDEARDKLDDGWKQYQDGVNTYKKERASGYKQLGDAKTQLEDAKKQLDDAEQQLAYGENQLQLLLTNPNAIPEIGDARRQLDDGWAQYQAGLQQYQSGQMQLQQMQGTMSGLMDTARQGLAAAQATLDEARVQHEKALAAFEQTAAALQNQQEVLYQPVAQLETELLDAQAELSQKQAYLDSLDPLDPLRIGAAAAVAAAQTQVQMKQAAYDSAKAAYDVQAAVVEQQLQEARSRLELTNTALEQAQLTVNSFQQQVDDGQRQMDEARQELESGKVQLDQAKAQLDAGEKELSTQIQAAIASAQSGLITGKKQLEEGKIQYEEGMKEYEEGKQEAEAQMAQAEKDLGDARRELQKGEADLQRMESPTYFILNPGDNNGFSSFDNDSNIIASIANVFPLFFFLVAALVCSSTMTRMVEEQRTQNGTLKALGYSDFKIMTRYAGYAAFAAIIGVILGTFMGTFLFPFVIWSAYKLLYHFGDLNMTFQWPLIFIALLAALACCVGAACAAAWGDLRQMPAQLMRPKAPKAGKRIFLEYIKPLWNHMSFLAKVSMRNIFRYKKRLFMMILGTGGCLALLIAGMGLKDSISGVADDQYDNISLHDFMVTFSSSQTQQEQEAFRQAFADDLDQCVFAATDTLKVPADRGSKDVNLVATNDGQMDQLVGLFDGEEDLGYPTGDGLYISDALAEDLHLQVGDKLPVMLETNAKIEIPITGIFTNYVFHAAYMTADGYETWFGVEPELNTAFASSSLEDLEAVNTRLQTGKGVINVTTTQSIRDIVADSMNSLDAVVALVVACAAALSFVVGYNLININITERVREIATIKVLGFYRKETYIYVFRESIILTFLGAIVGVPLGIWLHGFIMNAVTVDFVSFQLRISPLSFLIGIAVTILVTLIVNLMLSRKIDKINMAESLKSVE